jgi:hypothetical protein
MSRVKPFLYLPIIIKKAIKATTFLLLCSGFITSTAGTYDNNSVAKQTKPKRIEVYSLSQNYWDTQVGDTLGSIVQHLLPNNPSKRAALKQDIVRLNPGAFINSNPEQLLANKRLWLPSHMKQADSKADPATTKVERYSWGNIKRQRK